MYCKHCGKVIADDSQFCQYCGSLLEDSIKDNPTFKKDGKGFLPIVRNLSDKTKLYVICYGLWVILHLFWLFSGDKSSVASSFFQPFADIDDTYESFYDISEFIVYTLGLPLIIILLFILYQRYKRVIYAEPKDKVESFKKQHKKAVFRIGIWAAICFAVSLFDYWEDGTYDKEDLFWWIIIGSIILVIICIWDEITFLVGKIRNHFNTQ